MMVEWIVQFSKDTMLFNSLIGIFAYWVPMSLCVAGYTVKTFRNVAKDKERRSKAEEADSSGYYPGDTIGDLIGRAIVSFIPVANLWAGYFDASPQLFGPFFNWIGKVFDQPLVPKRLK